MTKRIEAAALACLATALFIRTANAQDNSPSNPASVGTPVKSLVEIGSVYSSNYEITIAVLEVVRGKRAMDLLKETDPKVKSPQAGFEYLLARVKLEIKARELSDKRSFDLTNSPLQWVAYSREFAEYESVSVTIPKPALAGSVRPGEAAAGWVAFAIEEKESHPIMAFDPDAGGAAGRGKTLFFKLY